MPILTSPQVAIWLQKIQILPEDLKISKSEPYEFAYNQQIYLENGYLIGQLLRNVLKMNGNTAEGLLRIRKIAYLTSNQNWHILKDILTQLTFDVEIDPEHITTPLIEDILEFLFDIFAAKPVQKKQKVTTIDLHSFEPNRPIQASHNLLQFIVLTLQESMSIEVTECMGLLINQGRYFKQIIVTGTNDQKYEPVKTLYQRVIAHIEHLNNLLGEEYGGEEYIMKLLGYGVMSESSQVCHLCCQMLCQVDSDWPEQAGVTTLIKSPHHQALDLLFRRLGPNIGSILNENLHKKLEDNFIVEMKVYTRLIRYYHQSLFGKQALKCLDMCYYVSRAFDLFQPDRNLHSSIKQRNSARILLAAIVRYFDNKLTALDQGKILYCFDPALTHTCYERFTSIAILFELLHQIMQKQRQYGFKLFGVIWKYYAIDHCKDFVMDNLTHMFRGNPSNFPIAQFMHLYEPSSIFQQNEFELLLGISQMKELSQPLGETMLQIATIYYYQQLHASCVIEIILNIIKNKAQVKWALQISVQILGKWPSLHIPPYQPLPPQSKKIKFRSVGLKKRQMMQFTQINRYKNLLLALTQIKDKNYLINYFKNITLTIKAVQKSKIKQMKNTQGWLNQLLALVDRKKLQIRENKITPVATLEQGSSASSYIGEQTLSKEEQMDRSLDEQDDPFKMEQSDMDNQFIRDIDAPIQFRPLQFSPLLPFSDEQIEFCPLVSSELFFENYQNIYIHNLNQKYSSLLQHLTTKYKTSLDLQHFFKNSGIYTYIQDQIKYLMELDKKLELIQDNVSKRVQKLIVQVALLAFEFKKSRRITIKCLESFYSLLESKNPINYEKKFEDQPTFTSKVQFDSNITPLLKKAHPQQLKYFQCFELVSDLLEKALGITEIQPVSKIVSQFNRKITTPQSVSFVKEEDHPLEQDSLTKQMHELERIIQNESAQDKITQSNYRSTPLKKKNKVPAYQSVPPSSSAKQTPERWLQVQKKIAKRRQQLQSRVKNNT